MNMDLFLKALVKYLLGLIIVGLLIFLPAGSFKFFNGVLFMILLFIPMFLIGTFLMIKKPDLLKRRLDSREDEKDQKKVIIFSALMFIIGFIISGLNYRYDWFVMPGIIVIIASVLFFISYILYFKILIDNEYLYRTIKVDNKQKVIDTGLYKIVRHPMYAVTILMFLMIPLVLGSIISFIVFLIYPFIIVKRIKNEEIVLEKELSGYKDYKKKVRYRLIPFVW